MGAERLVHKAMGSYKYVPRGDTGEKPITRSLANQHFKGLITMGGVRDGGNEAE